MKTRSRVLIIFLIVSGLNIFFAQNVSGNIWNIADGKKIPAEGVIIKWINTDVTTVTDADGWFLISGKNITDQRIIISYAGFKPVIVPVKDFKKIEITLKNPSASGEKK
jgi:hypothetical protein